MLAKYGEAARRGLASGPAYENADVPDHAYSDGYETLRAIATMKEMVNNGEKSFFLALGFKKPHLNWTAPKRYWDLYDPEQIPMATQVNAPEKGAAMGLHASFELRTRAGIPKFGPIKPDLARTLKLWPRGKRAQSALRRELDALVNLTPGDFAAVARQASVCGPPADAAGLVVRLRDECRVKTDGAGAKVGFVGRASPSA